MKIKILKPCPIMPGEPGEVQTIMSIQPHILEMFKEYEKQGYIEIINDTEMVRDPNLGLYSKRD